MQLIEGTSRTAQYGIEEVEIATAVVDLEEIRMYRNQIRFVILSPVKRRHNKQSYFYSQFSSICLMKL